ncbi:uncharacterized protein LOC62_02G003295 [Vanrija pseudolonga]|uniref:Cyanovirin-N domain-containing protein n=1 Tax=Vanrija pseudolonga TaxID=143232 RepID=A0AAF0Y861_9TREE|nr:hypothetical protein LOC62_02G003295 [Vanrija pseudolonga]
MYTAVLLALAAVLALAHSALASPAIYRPFALSSALNCRKGPESGATWVKRYSAGEMVFVACQVRGEWVRGNNIWDLTQDGCFVSDRYVVTGMGNNFITDIDECLPGEGNRDVCIPYPCKKKSL